MFFRGRRADELQEHHGPLLFGGRLPLRSLGEGASLSFSTATGPQSCGFVSYDNPESIAAKGTYLKAQGLGGVIMWTINQNYIATAPLVDRNALLSAVNTSVPH